MAERIVRAGNLGHSLTPGILESNKIHATRYHKAILAKNIPSNGQIPNGINYVISYNGNYKSGPIKLPASGNFIGEVFVWRQDAELETKIAPDNTSLFRQVRVKGGGNDGFTAIWTGISWLVNINEHPVQVTSFNKVTPYSTTWAPGGKISAHVDGEHASLAGLVRAVGSGQVAKGDTLFTLPEEAWPRYRMLFSAPARINDAPSTVSSTTPLRIDIATDGVVKLSGSENPASFKLNWLSLTGINYNMRGYV
jgi:hypothetical protein